MTNCSLQKFYLTKKRTRILTLLTLYQKASNVSIEGVKFKIVKEIDSHIIKLFLQ